MKTSKGFTLIELAVVIAIIAILAAVAIPYFGDATATAECSTIKDMTSQLNSAASIYTAKNAATPTSFTDFVKTTAVAATDKETISLATFGPNSSTTKCNVSGNTITCTGTFSALNPTYTFTNGVATLAMPVPLVAGRTSSFTCR